MPITETLAMGVACILTSAAEPQATNIWNNLSADDKIQVQAQLDSGTCLPEKIEKILSRSEGYFGNGEADGPNPTQMC